MSIEMFKKRLERFGTFVDGPLALGRGAAKKKGLVERFDEEIDKQVELYEIVHNGGSLGPAQTRRKWWFQYGRDSDRYVLIPKWRGKPLDLKDLFGGNFIVEWNKVKPALDVLKEMNEKLYFEKQLQAIEKSLEAEKGKDTSKAKV